MKLPRIVYAIQHNMTKRIYVGSSANVENRYWNHMNNLRNHKHNIEDMQSDYDNYGEDYSLYLLDEIKVFSESNTQDSVMNVFWLKTTELSCMCWCRIRVDTLQERKIYTIRQLLAWKICISGRIQDCLK